MFALFLPSSFLPFDNPFFFLPSLFLLIRGFHAKVTLLNSTLNAIGIRSVDSKTELKPNHNRLDEIYAWLLDYYADPTRALTEEAPTSNPLPPTSPYYHLFTTQNESELMREKRRAKEPITSYAVVDDEDLEGMALSEAFATSDSALSKEALLRHFVRTQETVGLTEAEADKLIALLLSDEA